MCLDLVLAQSASCHLCVRFVFVVVVVVVMVGFWFRVHLE